MKRHLASTLFLCMLGVFCIAPYTLAQSTTDTEITDQTPEGAASPETDESAIIPSLSVDIPGVTFTNVLRDSDAIYINFLGEYISGAYAFILGIGTTIAIISVMVAGLRYALAGSGQNVESAKRMIKNAIMGLVLLLCVYMILILINPRTTLFKEFKLELIPIPEEIEDEFVNGEIAAGLTQVNASNIQGPGAREIPEELVDKLLAAAETLESQGYGMYITSSFRDPADQEALIYKNCRNPPGSQSCNPKPGRPMTCIMRDNNPANCPHTTGRALDVWATEDSLVCITQSQCSKNPNTDTCRKNACQAALIEAMREQGFCSLSSEAWHFEQPKMSSRCN